MTCIVALAGKVVTVGADSLATAQNFYKELRRDDKIFRAGPSEEYVVGFSSSYRGGQIIRYNMEWPAFPDIKSDDDVLRFFVCEIVPVMQRTFEYHWTNKDSEDEFECIIAVGEHFVVITDDMQVAMVHDFVAIGSGASVAMGALEVLTKGTERLSPGGPERIVLAALAAAEKHTAAVAKPFVIKQTKFTP